MFIADAKKSEENVSVINKKIAASTVTGKVSVAVVLASMLSLAACGGGGSSTPAPGTGSTGGGTTAAACTDIAGEPDIMGAITYTPATAKPGDTVIMHVPVDAETAAVTASLSGLSGGTVVGVGTAPDTAVSTAGAQTVDVPVTISSVSGAGDYFVVINICSAGINACNKVGSAPGVAIDYASNPVIKDVPLTRFKYFANGAKIDPSASNLPTNSCVTQPILTVTP